MKERFDTRFVISNVLVTFHLFDRKTIVCNRERERESSDRKSEFMKNGVEGRKLGRKKERKERKIRREEKQKSREKGIKQRANHLNRYI